MQGPQALESDRLADVTLADVVSAVMDVADEEWQVTAVVVRMLRNGSIRLRTDSDL